MPELPSEPIPLGLSKEELEAEAIYADFLWQQSQGPAASFESLVAEHAQLAGYLLELEQDRVRWQSWLAPTDERWQRFAEGIEQYRTAHSRYRACGDLGRGGMGQVERVHDLLLGREVARKCLRSDRRSDRLRALLVEEARVTAELDHPGIAPVFDLGVDAAGEPFFTSRIAAGRSFRELLEAHRDEDPDWPLSRVVMQLLRAAETVDYAHRRGVVHRDLKPDNLRVGDCGELYVLDWGLASRSSRTENEIVSHELETGRGRTVGTPPYMSPEQTHGHSHHADARSDVYSLGAILDEALCEEAPAALVAVCERAMRKDPAERYATAAEFAAELRRYLEGEVSEAFRSGAIPELRRWARVHPLLSGGLAAGLAVLVAISAFGLWSTDHARTSAERSERAATLAELDRQSIGQEFARSESLRRVRELRRSPVFDEPTSSALVPRLEHWLELASLEVASLAVRREGLARLRDRAEHTEPSTPEPEVAGWSLDRWKRHLQTARSALSGFDQDAGLSPFPGRVRNALGQHLIDDPSWRADMAEYLAASLANADRELPRSKPRWIFADAEVQRRHEEMAELVDELTALAEGDVPVLQDRLRWATLVERITLADHAEEWQRAIDAIAASPHYDGLELEPHQGLVPLREDPFSGLWEFWMPESGERPRTHPEENASGPWVIEKSTGMVFVLLPGGLAWTGAQNEREELPLYDAMNAALRPPPPQEVELAPFFLSKYEMTSAQARRFERAQPNAARFVPDQEVGPEASVLPRVGSSPVEWDTLLQRAGLVAPTSAQWEYAARAGTMTPWWCASIRDRTGLRQAANLADLSAARLGLVRELEEWDDGFAELAAVGSFRANPFGLHDVLGNARELCAESAASPLFPAVGPAALRSPPTAFGLRVTRGGDFLSTASEANSWWTPCVEPMAPSIRLGVRPVRPIEQVETP